MVLTQTLLTIDTASSTTADCVHLQHVHPHHLVPTHHHNSLHPAALAAAASLGHQPVPVGGGGTAVITSQLIVDDLTPTSVVVPLQPDSAALPSFKSHSYQLQQQQRVQHPQPLPQQHSSAMPNMAPTAAVVTQASASFRDSASAPLRKLSVDLIKTYKHINEVSVPLLNVEIVDEFIGSMPFTS